MFSPYLTGYISLVISGMCIYYSKKISNKDHPQVATNTIWKRIYDKERIF